jgi:hypothetical protein
VILRVIRGRADQEQLEALRGALESRLGPSAGELAGPTRFHLAARPADATFDVVIVTFWSSAEAAAGGDAREISPRSVASKAGLQGMDAAHFEVDETILRRSDEEPVAIRVFVGRFSKPGADIEMLDLLRRRAPLLGDEMTEAYVGRRIVGRAVEVAFISAWRELPADRRLEDPFWPDIVLRYDQFEIAVYASVTKAGA